MIYTGKLVRTLATCSTTKLLSIFLLILPLASCGGGGGGGPEQGASPPSGPGDSGSDTDVPHGGPDNGIGADRSLKIAGFVVKALMSEMSGNSGGPLAATEHEIEFFNIQHELDPPVSRKQALHQVISASDNGNLLERVDCDSGYYEVLQSGEQRVTLYYECRNSSQNGVQTLNGKLIQEDAPPFGDYDSATFVEHVDFSMDTVFGPDSIYVKLNGSTKTSLKFSEGLSLSSAHFQTDHHIENLTTCQGEVRTEKFSEQVTTTVTYDGEENLSASFTIDGNYQIEVNPDPDLTGDYQIQTLVLMQLSLISGIPHSGEMLVTVGGGSSVHIRYAEGGLYINETFYIWEEFSQEYMEDWTSHKCYWNAEGDDIYVGVPDDPNYDVFDVTVNGEPIHFTNASATFTARGGAFSLSAMNFNIMQGEMTELSIGGPGFDDTGTHSGSWISGYTGTYRRMTGLGDDTPSQSMWGSYAGEDGETNTTRWPLVITYLSEDRVSGSFAFSAGPVHFDSESFTDDATGVIEVEVEFDVPLERR